MQPLEESRPWRTASGALLIRVHLCMVDDACGTGLCGTFHSKRSQAFSLEVDGIREANERGRLQPRAFGKSAHEKGAAEWRRGEMKLCQGRAGIKINSSLLDGVTNDVIEDVRRVGEDLDVVKPVVIQVVLGHIGGQIERDHLSSLRGLGWVAANLVA